MEPKLSVVGLSWATFQVLRRTNANLAPVDPKVGADQRGHGLGVAMGVYTTSGRDQKKEAVRLIASAVARGQEVKLSPEVAGPRG